MRRNNIRFNHPNKGPVPMDNQLMDLNRELELLRRKRELLQRQQPTNPRNAYNNAPPPMNPWANTPAVNNFRHDAPSTDFANLYDRHDDPHGNQNHNRIRTRKRPFQQPRYEEPIPKQFRGQVSIPAPRNIIPPKPVNQNNNFGGAKRKVFTVKKTAPPKPVAAPIPPERLKPFKPQVPQVTKPKKTFNFTLKPGEEIPPMVCGKIGFAVGTLIKELGVRHPQDDVTKYYRTHTMELKKRLRARVILALANKEITQPSQILDEYYAMFPPTTDFEIIKDIEDYPKEVPPIKPSADPEVLYKQNFYKLMDKKLNEMFSTLKNIYTTEEAKIDDAIKEVIEAKQAAACKEENGGETQKPENEETDLKGRVEKLTVLLIEKYLPKLVSKRWKQLAFLLKNGRDVINTDKNFSVVIQGRPSLPPKTEVQLFLQEHNPYLVRKSRNELGVLFSDEADFDAILGKNGIKFGANTLIIKPGKLQRPARKIEFSGHVKKGKNDPNSVVDSALDAQIDNLLASLRNDENIKEELNHETENSAVENDYEETENGQDYDFDNTINTVESQNENAEAGNGDEVNELKDEDVTNVEENINDIDNVNDTTQVLEQNECDPNAAIDDIENGAVEAPENEVFDVQQSVDGVQVNDENENDDVQIVNSDNQEVILVEEDQNEEKSDNTNTVAMRPMTRRSTRNNPN